MQTHSRALAWVVSMFTLSWLLKGGSVGKTVRVLEKEKRKKKDVQIDQIETVHTTTTTRGISKTKITEK